MKNYQNIVVDGKEYGRKSQIGSAFFNEGKWRHFIGPFLPEDCSGMTFLEFGCNYGMYLKLAQKRGFATTVGIEANEDLRDITARYLGRAGQVLYTEINQDIFRNTFVADLPAADFVLMANFHYHVDVQVFMHLVDLLRRKTRYAIVVSADKVKRERHKAENDIRAVRRYFRAWTDVGGISGIPVDGDPAPREGMYSILFKTDVERVPIRHIRWGSTGRRFYERSVRRLRTSGERRPMNYPCLLRQNGSLTDGQRRLATLKIEGATTVLVEKV